MTQCNAGREEEAAMAHDIEIIKVKGWNAVTNYEINQYNVEVILLAPSTITSEFMIKSSTNFSFLFINKELVYNPKKYARNIGKGRLFLERLESQLRHDQMMMMMMTPKANHDQIQQQQQLHFAASGGTSSCFMPYHFSPGAATNFRHSTSSAFKPYNQIPNPDY